MPEPKKTILVEMRYSNGEVYRLAGDAADAWHRAVAEAVNTATGYGYPFHAAKLQYVPPPRPAETDASPLLEAGPTP
jgi:hypothetical protein